MNLIPGKKKNKQILLIAGLCLTTCSQVFATWSIVATDPETGEVGAAAATCTVGVEIIAGVVPGKGVILAQAATNLDARDRGVQMISDGGSPQDVIAQIANETFNPGDWLYAPWKEQQYGVAVINKKPAVNNFTGSETVEWSGAIARGNASVQGNMLYGPEIVAATMNAYEAYPEDQAPGEGCHHDLAGRLLHALAAGAKEGGDKRCTKDRAALSAFVTVARPDDPQGEPSLFLVAPKAYGILGSIGNMIFPYVPDEDTPPAVSQLKAMYKDWKSQHPEWVTRCESNKTLDDKEEIEETSGQETQN